MTDLDRIAPALAAFQAKMPVVAKRQTANTGTFSYKYADLRDVSDAAAPLLAKNGLAFTVTPRPTDQGFVVVGMLLHTSGQYLEASLPLYGANPQQLGSSLTYARRYLLGCLTGIVTDEDDDAQAAQDARPTEPPMTAKTRGRMFALFGEKGVPEEQQLAGINTITGASYTSRAQVSEAHARQVIHDLEQRPTPVSP